MHYQKWEYLILHVGNSEIKEKLAEAGQDGWELVTVCAHYPYYNRSLYFKRQIFEEGKET